MISYEILSFSPVLPTNLIADYGCSPNFKVNATTKKKIITAKKSDPTFVHDFLSYGIALVLKF